MKKILLLVGLILTLHFDSFSQCEVKSFKIDEKYTRYSMFERFYQNADLENGMKSVYVYANAFKDASINRTLMNNLVVTYMYSLYQPAFTPGKMTVNFSDGSSLTLNAISKSTNTANEIPLPERLKSIEGIFELKANDVFKITSSEISTLYIIDNREGSYIDITPKYKSLIIEMFNCVNN